MIDLYDGELFPGLEEHVVVAFARKNGWKIEQVSEDIDNWISPDGKVYVYDKTKGPTPPYALRRALLVYYSSQLLFHCMDCHVMNVEARVNSSTGTHWHRIRVE
jgi:hypothetical protein